MAQAPAARDAGTEYQAWVFWDEACRLFASHAKVAQVGYEHGDKRAFDDVTVSYSTSVPDNMGGYVTADYRQVKFNVDHTKVLTTGSLTDPDAINASSISLLKRLADAKVKVDQAGVKARFIFEATRPIAHDDPLAELVDKMHGGALRLEKLFTGGERSAMGKVRADWAGHLKLSDENELREILRPLRIVEAPPELQTRRRQVIDKLALHGFEVPGDDKTDSVYDVLIQKWSREGGLSSFTKESLEKLTKNEGLWRGVRWRTDRTDIGIRSFTRGSELLDDNTVALLPLESQFDGRRLRADKRWEVDIVPSVRDFIAANTKRGGAYTVHLASHASIAFLAGYQIDPKRGVDAAVSQPSRSGLSLWEVTSLPETLPPLNVSERPIGTGPSVAAAISITHSIVNDVETYVKRASLGVDRILEIRVPLPAGHAVRDGAHANALAALIVNALKEKRSAQERAAQPLHLFYAGPNGLYFFVGQQSRGLGTIQLYEHDFERAADDYEPSITLTPM